MKKQSKDESVKRSIHIINNTIHKFNYQYSQDVLCGKKNEKLPTKTACFNSLQLPRLPNDNKNNALFNEDLRRKTKKEFLKNGV